MTSNSSPTHALHLLVLADSVNLLSLYCITAVLATVVALLTYILFHLLAVWMMVPIVLTKLGACMHAFVQVLGRNLEALVTRAQEVKADWRDEFVSVEHMLLAFVDDTKFGTQLLKDANLDKTKIEAAVKEIRGSNRVTDQVTSPLLC